jgi:restriction endonuclease S subunit
LNPAERPWEDLKDHLAFNLFESLAALKAEVELLLAERHPAGARLAGRIRILGRVELLAEKRSALVSRVVTRGLSSSNAPMRDSGVAWLGDVPAHWSVSRVKDVAERIQTGSTPSTSERAYYRDGGLPWFGPGSFAEDLALSDPAKVINRKAVEDGEAPIFESGSTLVVGIGATLGKVGYITEPASCNQQITAVTFDSEVMREAFGAYQMKRLEPALRGIAPNTTLPILNQSDFGTIKIACPLLAEQREIADHLDRETARLDRLAARVEDGIARLREYRTALVSAAVTGRIDVREAEAPAQ